MKRRSSRWRACHGRARWRAPPAAATIRARSPPIACRAPASSARSRAPASRATAPTTCRRSRPASTLPQDVTFAPDGRLFIVDWNNHRIRARQRRRDPAHRRRGGRAAARSDDPVDRPAQPPDRGDVRPAGAHGHRGLAQQPRQDGRSGDRRDPGHRAAPASAASAATAARRRRRRWTCPSRSSSTRPATW